MTDRSYEISLLQALDSKIERLLRLEALQASRGMRQVDAIALFAAVGFDRHEIANLLNTTANTVSVTLSTMKSRKDKKADSA